MSPTTRTWDEAALPAALAAARRFEAAWRASTGRRPDPRQFLPDEPEQHAGAWLALLRADLALRRESREQVPLDWYRHEFPEIGDEAMVALIYEEFCLREESGESPSPDEYLARFPEVAGRLRRVLDIHGLVGSAQSATLHAPTAPAGVAFPEAGQTIAGFHLVEELGRGSFARVFLAEERQLADRPVALKVARAGSREPQTLARLQHTHIVPVHSYRTDPATGLHLLCMPYLGRVTLAQILADPGVARARSGAELVAALDRLAPAGEGPFSRATGRQALIERDFVRAIAWWGARLAEALAFAHERGVLHRDIKPSNVLVTADGMPMLLDFNLARESRPDDPGLSLGGTLAYMAPEHLTALAQGFAEKSDLVDGRADIYSLGVVLFEAMGARPFPPPPAGSQSVAETLAREAERRRAGPPRLRLWFPEVCPAFEAVVAKCLAPDPADRYASAAELSADLQAVADQGPLRFAREPLPSRARRLLHRHRVGLALALPTAAALVFVASVLVDDKFERVRRLDDARHLMALAHESALRDDLRAAESQFETASRLAEPRRDPPPLGWRGQVRRVLVAPWRREGNDPELEEVRRRAREKFALVRQAREVRERADALHRDADRLRDELLSPGVDPARASTRLRAALRPFAVLSRPDWPSPDDLANLDEARADRLRDDVDDILFLWAAAADRRGDPKALADAVALCDLARRFTRAPASWDALRARCAAHWLGHEPPPAAVPPARNQEDARACFRRALLLRLEGRPGQAADWLERAVAQEPLDFSYRLLLAEQFLESGRAAPALEHAGAALALRPDDPEAHRVRDRALSSLAHPPRAPRNPVPSPHRGEG